MPSPTAGRPRLAAVVLAAAIALTAAGCASTAGSVPAPVSTPTPTASANPLAAGGLQDPRERDAAAFAPAEIPVRVVIPALGVDSALEDLGIDADGRLAAPVDYDLAGWYAGGVRPGDIGPAIIAGHVDSPTAPAVFARIGELAPGDEVLTVAADGSEHRFIVTGTTQSAKSEFPTDAVYSNVPTPELRLITCAGAFDTSIGHYTDNLVVFASLAD
ncbi:hypothetical protein CVS47_01686 [Microbacterium lemovicicum]|uniref:Sortase family protein n=1 Tax=Microbacterium lemovicicum TaxID=1072463 RepID=A0A3S9WAG1_9MICO|nr:class F sortase [Microbacterium lemovicicum]AZS37061.1 hypothetical protein CVS47_01686 [Microbacterium lemovicicum]